MEKLIKKIKNLKKDEISRVINHRLDEFKIIEDKNKVFSELCFCILTANFQAEKSWEIQKELEKDFFKLNEKELAEKLKKRGHRFWPQRAERIVLVRDIFDELFFKLNNYEIQNKENNNSKKENIRNDGKNKSDDEEIREWIVKNVKGIGMKEASHFLRNIGLNDYAIIDFHILDLLAKEGLIKELKTLNKRRYIEIEEILRKLAKKLELSLGELDLYLWFLETGKVVK